MSSQRKRQCCEELGCEKGARDSTGRCKAHGGGKLELFPGGGGGELPGGGWSCHLYTSCLRQLAEYLAAHVRCAAHSSIHWSCCRSLVRFPVPSPRVLRFGCTVILSLSLSDAMRQGATRALKARRLGTNYTVEASGGRSWGATRALETRWVGASHMVEASGVRKRGAPRALQARQAGAKPTAIKARKIAEKAAWLPS